MIGNPIGSSWWIAATLCLSTFGAPSSPHESIGPSKVIERAAKRMAVAVEGAMTKRSLGFAQEATQEPSDEAAPMRTKPRRLPTYYSRVVRPSQREEIYAIQDRFEAEIAALQAQVDAKVKERDLEIEKVLDEDQLTEVKRLAEEARKRREDRQGGATEANENGGSGL